MPTLILVHIGDHFPEYMNDCISQLQKISEIPVHVLISGAHSAKLKGNVSIFPLEDIQVGKQRKDFETRSTLNSSFRGGFWKFSMMRFFYIFDHMVSQALSDVFHIENDNLIFVDFLEALEQFREKSMWCVMDSKTRCIPSFLYFKDAQIVSRLLGTCINQASIQITDMFALGKFRNDTMDEVGNLPIISNYAEPIDPIFYQAAPDFKFLFDGAAVGQYIGGVDPRNNSGITIGFINETCEFKCNKATIEWRDKKPWLNGMPLVNLHIHSKDLKRWMWI
jgi:hypothetical protein